MFQIWFLDYFLMSMSWASRQSLKSHWSVLLDQTPLQWVYSKFTALGIPSGWPIGLGERGDYSREAIILNISLKEGRLFEGGD